MTSGLETESAYPYFGAS